MKMTDSKEARLRRVIRDAMAVDPLISLRSLQAALELKLKREFSLEYISKLRRKVDGEMAVVADREKVEDRIKYLRETNRVLRDEMFRIAFPPSDMLDPPNASQRLRALEMISKMDRAQVVIEMDLGLFTRHLGQLDVDVRLKPIDDDRRRMIMDAFKNWGIDAPVMRQIEQQGAIIQKSTLAAAVQLLPAPAPTNAPARPQSIPTVGDLAVS